MKVTRTPLEGLLVIEPRRFQDDRGFFVETYRDQRYVEAGITDTFVQDNQSRSVQGVLRGMHFQVRSPQAKLVTLIRGRIYDVGVDLRAGSATFGQWFGVELSDDGPTQMYMPAGFAHGFCVLSDWADVHYKVDTYYDPKDEGGVRWDDPAIGIAWPLESPKVAARDAAFPLLHALAPEALPQVR